MSKAFSAGLSTGRYDEALQLLRATGDGPAPDLLSNSVDIAGSIACYDWGVQEVTTKSSRRARKSLRFLKEAEECPIIIRLGPEGETVIIVRLHPRD